MPHSCGAPNRKNMYCPIIPIAQVGTLHEILYQIRDDAGSTKQPPSNSTHLAEPPHIRERLIAEIKFFITSLQKKAGRHTHLVEYVTHVDAMKGIGEITGASRPGSSTTSRETPPRASSRGASNGR